MRDSQREYPSELQVFRDYLERHNLRYTSEREAIIKEIFTIHDHFDVDSLFMIMKEKNIQVSRASIYRILPLLIEAGLVEEIYFEDGHMHYEHVYGHDHHCHLRCMQCGKVEEFVDKRLDEIEKDIASDFGYRIINHRLEVRGLCPECGSRQDAGV
jgi:Fur family ferric uptake transcriptional regulator